MLATVKKYTLKSSLVNLTKITGVALLISMSSAASASDFSVAKKVEVFVSVAELESPAGLVKVYSNLTQEAQKACTPEKQKFSAYVIQACSADLLDQFVDDLDKPALTKLHKTSDS